MRAIFNGQNGLSPLPGKRKQLLIQEHFSHVHTFHP